MAWNGIEGEINRRLEHVARECVFHTNHTQDTEGKPTIQEERQLLKTPSNLKNTSDYLNRTEGGEKKTSNWDKSLGFSLVFPFFPFFRFFLGGTHSQSQIIID